jgi:hypothetical protein
MACTHITSCPLFPQFTLKASLNVWQVHYCNGDFEKCARLKLSKAGQRVPPNLLPNGKSLDLSILNKK